MPKNSEQYSAEETAERVKAAVRGAFKTEPKPLKGMTPKSATAQSKKRRKPTDGTV
jgi:hypothetical protein